MGPRQLQLGSEFEQYDSAALAFVSRVLPSEKNWQELLPAYQKLQETQPLSWNLFCSLSAAELQAFGIAPITYHSDEDMPDVLAELLIASVGYERWMHVLHLAKQYLGSLGDISGQGYDFLPVVISYGEDRLSADSTLFDKLEVGLRVVEDLGMR